MSFHPHLSSTDLVILPPKSSHVHQLSPCSAALCLITLPPASAENHHSKPTSHPSHTSYFLLGNQTKHLKNISQSVCFRCLILSKTLSFDFLKFHVKAPFPASPPSLESPSRSERHANQRPQTHVCLEVLAQDPSFPCSVSFQLSGSMSPDQGQQFTQHNMECHLPPLPQCSALVTAD